MPPSNREQKAPCAASMEGPEVQETPLKHTHKTAVVLCDGLGDAVRSSGGEEVRTSKAKLDPQPTATAADCQ